MNLYGLIDAAKNELWKEVNNMLTILAKKFDIKLWALTRGFKSNNFNVLNLAASVLETSRIRLRKLLL